MYTSQLKSCIYNKFFDGIVNSAINFLCQLIKVSEMTINKFEFKHSPFKWVFYNGIHEIDLLYYLEIKLVYRRK